MQSNCESCNNYQYDDEAESYFCEQNLDEDEMSRFMAGRYDECPYYSSDDDYKIVKKQN